MSEVGKKCEIRKGEFDLIGRNDGQRMGCGGEGSKRRVTALPPLSISHVYAS
jgi:hypothetical protein